MTWLPDDELLTHYRAKLDAEDLPNHVKLSFSRYFRMLCANETGVLREDDKDRVDPEGPLPGRVLRGGRS